MSGKRITIVLGAIIVIFFGYIGCKDAVRTWQNLQTQKNQIDNLNTRYQNLNQELDKTKATKQKSQDQIKKLEQEKKYLEAEQQKLERQLQARAEAKEKLALASREVISKVSPSVSAASCGDNQYAAFIYQHESSCRPDAVNSKGCYGIGQDCNGVLKSKCGTDYTCQNAFFNDYAIRRYHSWAHAYEVWVSQGWW